MPESIFLDELIYLGLSKETLLAGVYFDSTSLCRSHFGPGSRHEPRDKISVAIYLLPGWALALPGFKFYSPGEHVGRPILLLARMITDQIGFHQKLIRGCSTPCEFLAPLSLVTITNVVRAINKICLITSMITDRIGRHEALIPINHNFEKVCDI